MTLVLEENQVHLVQQVLGEVLEMLVLLVYLACRVQLAHLDLQVILDSLERRVDKAHQDPKGKQEDLVLKASKVFKDVLEEEEDQVYRVIEDSKVLQDVMVGWDLLVQLVIPDLLDQLARKALRVHGENQVM